MPYWLKSAGSHLVLQEIVAGRAVVADRAGRRDVVGGDRIEEEAENAGAGDVGDRLGFVPHALEVGRVLDVGEPVSHLYVIAASTEIEAHGRRPRSRRRIWGGRVAGDLRRTEAAISSVEGQMSLNIDGVAVPVDSERLVDEVVVHRAGQRIGDDQRRRGQVVGPLGVDAALEFRLPESTAETTSSPLTIASLIGSANGPELPMQVVQP